MIISILIIALLLIYLIRLQFLREATLDRGFFWSWFAFFRSFFSYNLARCSFENTRDGPGRYRGVVKLRTMF